MAQENRNANRGNKRFPFAVGKHFDIMRGYDEARYAPFCLNPHRGTYCVIDKRSNHETVDAGPMTFLAAKALADKLNVYRKEG